MYISPRSVQVRNLFLAIANGSITLIILLIAPLGLMAVIVNTALVAAATYGTAIASDRIILYLQGDHASNAVGRSRVQSIDRPSIQSDELDRP